ncbi:hypothetical protein ACFQDI_04940 [Prosthecobacter fluviatilis]|uniref:Uncharacterized protein n=2 Tax=Prosthecobacter fluviatilis TaxID=445931 RepID=A0ABW0KLR9_9BACT
MKPLTYHKIWWIRCIIRCVLLFVMIVLGGAATIKACQFLSNSSPLFEGDLIAWVINSALLILIFFSQRLIRKIDARITTRLNAHRIVSQQSTTHNLQSPIG